MEIQIKYRLSKPDYLRLLKAFEHKDNTKRIVQMNHFFDGENHELIRNTNDKNYSICLKECTGNASNKYSVDVDGTVTRFSKEISINSRTSKKIISDPTKLLSCQEKELSELIQYIHKEFKVNSVIYLGGFQNVRLEIPWKNNKILLDATTFDFGKAYECEISNINLGNEMSEEIQETFELMMKSEKINYQYSKSSKFESFLKGEIIV